jgi:hypothetical protein
VITNKLRWALSLGIATTFGGCGFRVPELQDFGPRDSQIVMVQEIVKNVDCELRDAFYALYEKNDHRTFMDNWGISILLDLDITEKTTIAPSATWSPPPGNFLTFTLAGGISGSSQAERIDKLHSFFTVKEVLRAGPCKERSGGPMLMQSDLKLTEWLFDVVVVQLTRQADFNRKGLPDDVLYHEVQFEVDTSASATPGFKLTRVNVNDSGDFFSTSRNRTHDLQITLGPTDQGEPGGTKKKTRPGPGTAATNVAQASAIGQAVGNAVKNALRPR